MDQELKSTVKKKVDFSLELEQKADDDHTPGHTLHDLVNKDD